MRRAFRSSLFRRAGIPPGRAWFLAVSSGVMPSGESFPTPRRHLVDPRLRRKMERLLSRVDGGSSRRNGVMKARAGPLSSSLVASILTKVDNDLRRQIAAARRSDVSSSSSDDSTGGPSNSAVQGAVSEAVNDPDYEPDDRDPSTLPAESVRETKRYAYREDDFDAYLGKAMRTTSFFSPPPEVGVHPVPVPSV